MTLPKWLAQEIDQLAGRVKNGEVEREAAIGKLADDTKEKDEAFVRELLVAHLSGKLDNAVKRLKDKQSRRTDRELDRMIVGEATFDDICSDYWPRDTFGPRTPLEELVRHDQEMLGLAERHNQRAKDRHKRTLELVAAAQGNLQMAWEEAERRRLSIQSGAV